MARVALISTSYPDDNPGSEAAGGFVEDFARELARSVPVSVVAASRSDSVTNSGNLRVRRFAVPRLPLSLLRPHNPFDWPALVGTLRAGRHALRQAIAEDRPDHVFALWVLPSGWWARAETAAHGVPFSTWALGSDIWSLGRIPLVRGALAAVLSDAEHRYADGLALGADVENLCGKECTFLPSARSLPPLRNAPVARHAPYKLAFLGRWHRNKGIDILMRALLELGHDDWEKIEEVRICGGGPLQADVNAVATRLGADQRPVSIGGFLDKEAAATLIGWADYLLLPSRIESIPVIFSDAMQLGTPLISTPVGDLPRLHAQYGFGILAGEASPGGLRDALRQALEAPAADFVPGVSLARCDFDPAASATRFLQDIGLNGQ